MRSPLTSTNRRSMSRASSREAMNGNRQPYDGATLARRVGEISRSETNLSRSPNDPDSPIDSYNPPPSARSEGRNFTERMTNGAEHRGDDDPNNKWIHRDKLAKIESQELQAAGIDLSQARRPSTRSRSRRGASRHRDHSAPNATDSASQSEHKRRRASSPVTQGQDDERMNWDLRTPEEIAADPLDSRSGNALAPASSKKNGSKIPVFAHSSLPISTGHIERTTPIPRKRHASLGAGEDEEFRFGTPRSRAGSIGSQVLLDEYENGRPATSSGQPPPMSKYSSSPTKSTPLKSPTTSTPGSRKTSSGRKPSAAQKPRVTSGSSTANRPVTRSGDDRPRTAINRPEGDPPWLATMYKPDPRLPPDQQIIPTHARKQQQALWDQEGAVPMTYDRNFSPLAVHTADGLQRTPTPPRSPQKDRLSPDEKDNNSPWPLRSATSNSNLNGRPGTSGGYSTMPNVKRSGTPVQSPPLEPKAFSPRPSQQRVQRVPQAPDDDEKGDKSKGCGCCIVM